MSVRKKTRNNAGVFVPGLTDSHINEFFLNHKSELYLGKKIKRNYQNIKSICLIDNTLISTIYDPFTKNTHNVSTDFIGIPVNSSEDINPRRTFCTCLQYRLHSSLCQHTAAQLGSAVDRYFSQSILYPYDPIAFNVFIDKNNNIVKYEYQDVTLHQYELPQNTPHPQHIFIETLQAKQLCGDKHVLCLILMYSGNADCRSLICPFCDQKYAWKSKILSFEHYCADGTHYSKSIFQRTPIFGDISSVKFFKSLFNIAEDKGRRTWVDAQNNDRISRKTMTSNFHKIAAVSRIVMNHTVPVGATPYRAVELKILLK